MPDEVPGDADPLVEFTMADATPIEALPADRLRHRCDPESLRFESTDSVEPLPGVIGQDAAMEALRFGLEIHAPGQNIFVRGLTGTGRMTLVRRLMEEIRPACPEARDRCYVHSFHQPQRPRLITLPRGRGRSFQRRVNELVDFIRDELEEALSSKALDTRREGLQQATQSKIDEITEPFSGSLRQARLSLVTIKVGRALQSAIVPLMDGKPGPPDQWEQLRSEGKISDEEATAYQERVKGFQPQLRDVMDRVNDLQVKHADAARALRGHAIRSILDELVRGIKRNYAEESVTTFLDEIMDDVAGPPKPEEERLHDCARKYRVNLLHGHADESGCSIIVENAPTVSNLLGSIEHLPEQGGPGRSDHLMICAGSLLNADGGYLILETREILQEPGSWKVLLRTLRNSKLEILPPESTALWWRPYLKPEPIDINVKVILLGDSDTYYMLDAYDPDFPHLFKVLADFTSAIPRNDQSLDDYAGVFSRIVRQDGIKHFDRTAVAVLIEHGSRIAGRQNELTTRFGRLTDIAREASFIASKAGSELVGGDDVRLAIRHTKQRAELPSLRFRKLLSDGTIRLQTTGLAVGQINGLAVTHAGPLVYGFPARITASIGPGSAGIINIEGESNLSGTAHTKGFHILSGLLRNLLRTEHPLTFRASIAFEQSYGGIDGDSASGAEICCLLSALTEVPLRQDLAMTGAIDQLGNIMAIGAVNEKIEGFFDTCRDLGLSGTQGIIIPRTNAVDLMLREDVVEACREGRFHVYAVDRVPEALELLTGVAAGELGEDGQYPDNTLLGLSVSKAFEYWVKALQGLDTLQAMQGATADEADAAAGSVDTKG